jgi:hypothetical protein
MKQISAPTHFRRYYARHMTDTEAFVTRVCKRRLPLFTANTTRVIPTRSYRVANPLIPNIRAFLVRTGNVRAWRSNGRIRIGTDRAEALKSRQNAIWGSQDGNRVASRNLHTLFQRSPKLCGRLEPKSAQKKSTSYSIRSISMKRNSLIEGVSPEARDFIEPGTAKAQFVKVQPDKPEGEASPALVPELPKTAIDVAGKKEIPASVPVLPQPADEIPSPVLGPRTFRLPQRLIEELARAGELRALSWLDREGNTWLPISSKSTVP